MCNKNTRDGVQSELESPAGHLREKAIPHHLSPASSEQGALASERTQTPLCWCWWDCLYGKDTCLGETVHPEGTALNQ